METLVKFYLKKEFYEVLSISKAVVGLAFLESDIDVSRNLIPEIQNITIQDALCHHTGIENNGDFDFFEFMDKVKQRNEDIDEYAKQVFLTLSKGEKNKDAFKYNNIVFRILTGILERESNGYLNHWVGQHLSAEEANWGVSEDKERWGSDKKGIANGLNGLRLTVKGILNLLKTANQILQTKKIEEMTIYPEIENGNHFRAFLPSAYKIYSFYNWCVIIYKNKIRGVYSIGYNNQFVCLDFINNRFGFQFRVPFWDEHVDHEAVNFVKEFFETNTILPFTESQCFDKVDKVTVKKIKQVGYLSNLKK